MLNVSSGPFEKLLAAAQARVNARQLPEAEQLIRQALAINPAHPAVQHLLGVLCLLTQRQPQAIEAFQKVIATQPTAEAYLNLIQLLNFTRRADEALATARKASTKYPHDPRIVREFGRVLESNGLFDEALRRYRDAAARWPNDPLLLQQHASLLFFQGRVAEAVAEYRKAVAANPQHAALHSALLYTLHFLPGMGAMELLHEHQRWNQRHAHPLGEFQPWANVKQSERPLRIGYLSPNLKMHSVGRFIAPLLARHDHAQFQVVAYSDVHTPDQVTQRIQAAVDVYRPCFGLSDAQVAQQIRTDAIDILVDLAMHMPGNRQLVFARKPAPVQVSYLAYVGTTGLGTMDYRLSDKHLDPPPPPSHDSTYSEETLHLPSYWCYEPLPDAPETTRQPPDGPLTFGCLNNLAKVSPLALETWSQILTALPDAQLLLHCVEGDTRATLAAQLAKLGIAESRIRFAGRIPLAQFLQLHQQIDIALDPFPYGGGTTSCDALWMGVPVITLNDTSPDSLAVGRGGASILRQLGLHDLIAPTREQYVQLAITLAHDPTRRAHLRQTLRQIILTSPLTNAPAFARSIENAYRDMWRQYCQTS